MLKADNQEDVCHRRRHQEPDFVRRLIYTSKQLEPKYKIEVVDEYCDKLVRCGYL